MPMNLDAIDLPVSPQPEMKPRSIVALVAPSTMDFGDLTKIAGDDGDLRSDGVTVGLDADQTHLNPMVSF